MSTVRVTCLLCEHDVEVPAPAVVLHLDGRGPDAVNRYGFTCPRCAVYVVRPANDDVVAALLATDVEVASGPVPPWAAPDRPPVVIGPDLRRPHGSDLRAPRDSDLRAPRDSDLRAPRDSDLRAPRDARVTHPGAPPITEADVLLFRKALEDDGIMAAWLSA